MTARKPKPKPRKASDPAIRELRTAVRDLVGITDCQRERIEALESRDRLRDKSHDAPVSNENEAVGKVFQSYPPRTEIFEWTRTSGEAVGQHFRIVDELPRRSWWRRLLDFMGAA